MLAMVMRCDRACGWKEWPVDDVAIEGSRCPLDCFMCYCVRVSALSCFPRVRRLAFALVAFSHRVLVPTLVRYPLSVLPPPVFFRRYLHILSQPPTGFEICYILVSPRVPCISRRVSLFFEYHMFVTSYDCVGDTIRIEKVRDHRR